MTSKGEVTLPAEVRRHLGIGTRDKVTFVIDEHGTVQIRATRYPTISSFRGAAGSLETPLTWEEMRQIAREDWLRSKCVDARQ